MKELLCWPWRYEEQGIQIWSLYEIEPNSPRLFTAKMGPRAGWVVKYPNGTSYHFNYIVDSKHTRSTCQTLEEAKQMVVSGVNAKVLDEKLVNLL